MKRRIVAIVAALALVFVVAAPVGAASSDPYCVATQNLVAGIAAKPPATQGLWLHILGLPSNFLSLSSHQQAIAAYNYPLCP